jgi:N-acetylglutamate synthase-like GNAT family acetyltransferase
MEGSLLANQIDTLSRMERVVLFRNDAMHIRHADSDDLDNINRVIDEAVMTWQLPERVKRLSLASYRYQALDLDHLQIQLAETDHTILGLAAVDDEPVPVSDRGMGLLLHGLYVSPQHHHQGIGAELFEAIESLARQRQLDGILVKAQKDAVGFFEKQGMAKLPVENDARDYANRYWKGVD